MNYTDEQFKAALAKMLPNDIKLTETKDWANNYYCYLSWKGLLNPHDMEVRDTELLHLCHLVEKSLCEYSGEHGSEYSQRDNYAKELMKLNGIYNGNGWSWGDVCNADLFRAANSTWQQRVIALAKVKGIEMA